MGNNENDLSDNIYEQLQEFLNGCIILGRGYKWIRNYLYCTTAGLWNNDVNSEYFNELISYHELFSKDSGLMEFVEWEDYGLPNRYYIAMCAMTGEEKIQYFISNARVPGTSK